MPSLTVRPAHSATRPGVADLDDTERVAHSEMDDAGVEKRVEGVLLPGRLLDGVETPGVDVRG